jgi:hypothetical protein
MHLIILRCCWRTYNVQLVCCAGRVWDACETAKKAAYDNKAAYFRHLAIHVTVLNDTLREVRTATLFGPARCAGVC